VKKVETQLKGGGGASDKEKIVRVTKKKKKKQGSSVRQRGGAQSAELMEKGLGHFSGKEKARAQLCK